MVYVHGVICSTTTWQTLIANNSGVPQRPYVEAIAAEIIVCPVFSGNLADPVNSFRDEYFELGRIGSVRLPTKNSDGGGNVKGGDLYSKQ